MTKVTMTTPSLTALQPRRKGVRALGLSLGLMAATALVACSGQLTTRGNLLTAERIEEISAGESFQSDVVAAVGTPSAVSTFESNTWYYIGELQEQQSFLDPDVIERNVLVVNFDDAGLVQSTQLYTVADGQIINPVSRTTPTEGRELTILQQLLGNLGRFSPDAANETGN